MDMNVIRGRHLTGFGVAPDGESIAIHLMDEESRPATLLLPAECLSALIMTLPEILRRSLHLRFHDDRCIQPRCPRPLEDGHPGGLAVYDGHRYHRQLIDVAVADRGGTPMRFMRILAVGVAVVLLTAAGARAQDVTLSVAVSLKGVTEELGRSFMAAHPGVTLRYNFGASGDLQKQIEAGAPIDVFLSAAQRQMDELERQNLIVSSTRRAFARNVLTVIKPADSRIDIAKPADLLDARVGRIAIGSPKTVPAGQYAEESLRALGLWDRLQSKLVFAENVRQALDYVARGEVDAGFVYTTDAATRAQGVKEALRPPDDSYRPIVYPGAVVAAAKQPALGQAFLDLLGSPQGRTLLSRFGFQPPPAGAR
jgi:molybdate transport system substrate-binding protein